MAQPPATPRTPNVGAWSGAAALAVAFFTVVEFAVRQIFVGSRPGLGEAEALIAFSQRTAAGTLGVIVIDTFLMASLIVFLASFRQLITQRRRDLDWVSALAYGAGIAYVAVTLVGDGMEGGAALDAAGPHPDIHVIRTLTLGHALLFGSIGCVLTALVAAASGYVTIVSGALPRWTGRLALVVAAANIAAVATVFGGTDDSFHSVGGWGTAALATFPWLVWVVCVGIVVIRGRRDHHDIAKADATASVATIDQF
ncbi:hypothetical protein [Pseudolysinimonas sp.]|uniref:hypothetical protein n=1 Tax=Pseudolysinimonas sp. TaxID=2680009 RepID=UPI003F7CFCA8